MPSPSANETLARVVREERTRLVATLVRRHGFDLAEESVDAAIALALVQWAETGVPDSPRAWLLQVARRRAVDRLRRLRTEDASRDTLRGIADESVDLDPDAEAFPDDRLRLLFTCCHPALARDAQVALALRWLSGLSTEDVARAFCVPVPTMAQRLTRAKSKIERAGIPYEVPERRELAGRLEAVLEVVYAIFNEGYVATAGDSLQRVDLAEEAVRLAGLVVELLPDEADAKAMAALVTLVHARRFARVGSAGELVRLEDQDRSLWDMDAVARGKDLLARALATGAPSSYAIEAAIQAVYDDAPAYDATDFPQIAALYALLRAKTDAPLVRVNEAVVRERIDGPAAALALLEALDGDPGLEGHPALPAAKAAMFARLGRDAEARSAFDAAIAATRNEVERAFLTSRKALLR
ncbi:MAG: DUF6596 domain-containing protein [Polyangiaceae bacterium]